LRGRCWESSRLTRSNWAWVIRTRWKKD